MISGEYWAYKEPSEYSFEYFKFRPCFVGHADSNVSLSCIIYTLQAEDLALLVIKEKEKYHYSFLSIQKGCPHAVKISISGYMLFDYDMLFAKNIEKVICKFNVRLKQLDSINNTEWSPVECHRPLINSCHVSFSQKWISWVNTSPDQNTGIEKQRLRLDLHHTGGLDREVFFVELKAILDDCQIQCLDYKEYMDNYMIFLGNGRQGINGMDVVVSNFSDFKEKLLSHLVHYGFEIDHNKKNVGYQVGLGNYNILIKSKTYVVKDERN